MKRFSLFAAALTALTLTTPAQAADLVEAEVRQGWTLPDGRVVAGLHLRLAEGWKTYWRAPGDAGIPPLFNWGGSRNLKTVAVVWPTPQVFWQSGMRSIGYEQDLVLPLILQPGDAGAIALRGDMDIGLCKEVCIPYTVTFAEDLSRDATSRDPMIVAALADVPYSESEASVAGVTCSFQAGTDGMTLRADIQMPSAGGTEQTVIEAGNPMVWVAEPKSQRQGNTLTTEARMMHIDGGAFALDRSAVRITVLGQRHAVDIQGCD